MSLYDYTIAEIAVHLEERAFPRDHIIELTQMAWHLEHPLTCRLMQYDETTTTMLSLRESCAVNQAMEHGLARTIQDQRGFGRHTITPKDIALLMQPSDTDVVEVIKSVIDKIPGMTMMTDEEFATVLNQMDAHHDAQTDEPDELPQAPIGFIPSGLWDSDEPDILHLLTSAEFEKVPDGAMLVSIGGKIAIKGIDDIDLDTRGGCIAYGFRDSQLLNILEATE